MYAIRSYYVLFARMAGLPARVVTGYKADRANSVNNYLAVKERDAHAWAEVYTGDRWQRVETVITSYSIHYTKLYETLQRQDAAQHLRRHAAAP